MIETKRIDDILINKYKMEKNSHPDEDLLRRVEFEFTIARNKNRSFVDRFKAFLRGENKAGRTVGRVLDVVTVFNPFGTKDAREVAGVILNRNTPKMLKDKKWYQSKTIWAAVVGLVTGLLQAAGIDLTANPEITDAVYNLLYAVAGSFGLYGLRDAVGRANPAVVEKNKPKG